MIVSIIVLIVLNVLTLLAIIGLYNQKITIQQTVDLSEEEEETLFWKTMFIETKKERDSYKKKCETLTDEHKADPT